MDYIFGILITEMIQGIALIILILMLVNGKNDKK